MHTKKLIFLLAFCFVSSLTFAQKGESDSKVQMGTSDDRPAYTKIDLQKAAKENARKKAEVEVQEEIFIVVEEMPVYPTCEGYDRAESKQCTQEAILKYLVKHLKYPAELKKNNVTGTVIAQFVINSSGSMKDIKILRTPAPEMTEEVKRVLSQMSSETEKQWRPGMQRSQPVGVRMTIPVKFAL